MDRTNLSRSDHDHVPWQSGPQTRGTLNIIWSCLAVIIMSTYTVLHLNVPSVTRRKLKWMILAFLFPEFIFAYAVIELKMALDDYIKMGKHEKEYFSMGWFDAAALEPPPETTNNYHPASCTTTKLPVWSLTHCYYVNMGGIVTKRHDGENVCVQGYEIASPRLQFTQEAMSKIELSKGDIQDRSKADVFVRILWIWQLGRLLIELCVRAAKALPITQLEIIATSFAVLTFTTVLIQTHKPQNICQPYRVELSNVPENTPELKVDSLTWRFIASPASFRRSFNSYHRITNDNFRPGESMEHLFSIMLITSTTLFGAIHIAAWAFQFPTLVEAWIWRSCSLAGICIPLFVVLVTYLLHLRMVNAKGHVKACQTARENAIVHRVFQFGSIVVYFSTRLLMITIAFASFRSAPRGIYQETWAGFLPAIQ
ncbi:hypothetical protein P154DRAFT_423706 [Amniculicola lignicola CBS 123094]|uniref:Uncharacterized protein n=1 Tax=Amniculicola lignicola CBS 123094 TaxID=1392246 RepID=A0A6A5WZ19_9PLEO|nr:hypothetical protein P154DRAFT_423706 [Amniculicola lignicola CBS 123094]